VLVFIARQRLDESDGAVQDQLNDVVEALKVLAVFVATHALATVSHTTHALATVSHTTHALATVSHTTQQVSLSNAMLTQRPSLPDLKLNSVRLPHAVCRTPTVIM